MPRMTRDELLTERRGLVAKLHAAQAILDAALDRLVGVEKPKSTKKKPGKKA
jgi:hypothetical protein